MQKLQKNSEKNEKNDNDKACTVCGYKLDIKRNIKKKIKDINTYSTKV